MKKWSIIVAVATALILAVLLVHDFITSDPIHYFGEQPRQIILVAVIALVGGLVALAYYRLPSQWRDRVNICALALEAACLTAVTGFAVYYIIRWSSHSDSSATLFAWVVLLFSGSIAGLLWFRFWHRLRKRVL
jgi:uncharacterized integral membrane protein